jgi:phosphoribosylformimino-5-aminoimidazole carboxamide ribotide isomerase
VSTDRASERAGFELLPAIDLRDGRVVRLAGGDFAHETSYGDDAVTVARSWAAQGAEWLHVVDLDAARAGEPRQSARIRGIIEAVDPVRCQVAGGLRSAEDVERALAAGAARVVVGTMALRDATTVRELLVRHGASRVVVALDIRDGLAVGEGWHQGAEGVEPRSAFGQLADIGVEMFAVTAIDRDGLLGGPDLALLRELVGMRRGRVIASGGIRSIDDILATRDAGCAGVIVGRALYEGRIDLPAALAALREGAPGPRAR